MPRRVTMIAAGALLAAGLVRAADPWADQVHGHSLELDGSDLYNDPQSLLGMPSTEFYDIYIYFDYFKVSIVAPPFYLDAPGGNTLVTTIPPAQFVVVSFDEPVEDHPRNPYGIDLLVFGNAVFRSAGGWVTPDTDMAAYHLSDGSVLEQPVVVAVSATGTGTPSTHPAEWYVYSDGPHADSWYPTQAYDWDRQEDDWGEPKDYTIPVAPDLGTSDFASLSAADAIDLYEWSGGGTGFDLAESGFASIRYVYLTSSPGDSGEVDALSDVFPSLGDFDRNGALDLADFELLRPCLTGPGKGPRPKECFCADFDGDRDVDLADFGAFQVFFTVTN